jgi:ABC-type phosphate transport system substrate-binding protein
MFRLRFCPASPLRSFTSMIGCIAVAFGSVLALSLANEVIAGDVTVKWAASVPSNPTFSREQLREIFFSRQTRWPDGNPIRVFVFPDQHPIHIRFAKEILGVYPYQLRAAWDRMIYSGTGVPPTVVENVEEMRLKIEQTPGSIGYLEE